MNKLESEKTYSNEDSSSRETEKEIFDKISEHNRAQHYWEIRLKGENRIETPQNPSCDFCFVIPVYNESIERVDRQIESLRSQNSVDSKSFEIIYVVNNDILEDTDRAKEILANNARMINHLKSLSDSNIFVIDKSSPGNEIIDCNVGRARNRGVAEASIRFYENDKNGVIIQSDADTYFEDKDYFKKLKNIIESDPTVIGAAGGVVYEFNPDTKNEEEIALLKQKLDRVILMRKWDILVQAIRYPEKTQSTANDTFSGAHMISRSYETAVIGGLIDANEGEDPRFGAELKAYAAGRGQKIVGAKNDLQVITALRESDRTEASFKKKFDEVDLGQNIMVSDPFAPKITQFKSEIYEALEQASVNDESLRRILSDKDGDLLVTEEAFSELVDRIRKFGIEGEKEFYKQEFYKEWAKRSFGQGFDVMRSLYDLRYPQIPLDTENYNKIVEKVLCLPNGQSIMANLNNTVDNIRFLGS